MIKQPILIATAFAFGALCAHGFSTSASPPVTDITSVGAKYKPPGVVFRLDDLPFRTKDGRHWCPVPVTSLSWQECP